MNRRGRYIVFFVLYLTGNLFSQTSDTFLLRISKLHDTLKLKEYSAKILQLRQSGNWADMYRYAKELNRLATKCTKPKFVILSNTLSGEYLQSIGQLDKACDFYFMALKASNESNNRNGMSSSYSYLGGLYNDQKDYTKSLHYHRKALEIRKSLNNLKSISGSYNNIGIAFDNMRQFDSARYYYNASVAIQIDSGDSLGLASSFVNLGEHYLLRNMPDSAMYYYQKAIDIYNIVSDTYSVAWAELNYAKALTKKKEFSSSNKLIWKTMAFTVPNQEMSMLSRSYEGLYQNYEGLGRFDSALYYHKKMTTLSDSILDIDNKQHAIEQELAYQYDLKEQARDAKQREKDALALKEKQRQRTLFYSICVVLSLICVVAALIYRGLKQQRKTNRIISMQKEEVEQQKSLIEEHQKEILDSIHYAKRIQYTLLAHHDFVNANIPHNFILFSPKDIVSGDFYWATKHGNSFYLAVCDSTGHGVPGAFMSLLNIGFLSEAINEKNITEPNKIFDYVRERLINSISKEGQKDGFDGILVCLDQMSGRVTYSAANNSPLLVSGDTIFELEKDRMPVGKGEKSDMFKLYTVNAKSGDMLYLYTDGYADQFGGPKGKKFKYKQLNDLLLSVSMRSMEEQKDEISRVITEWKGDLEQVDDICVLGVRI